MRTHGRLQLTAYSRTLVCVLELFLRLAHPNDAFPNEEIFWGKPEKWGGGKKKKALFFWQRRR